MFHIIGIPSMHDMKLWGTKRLAEYNAQILHISAIMALRFVSESRAVDPKLLKMIMSQEKYTELCHSDIKVSVSEIALEKTFWQVGASAQFSSKKWYF